MRVKYNETYQHEYDEIDRDVGRAATNEEAIDVEAVTLDAQIGTVPSVMNGVTAFMSLVPTAEMYK